jgi:hypothetical protein
MANKFQSVSILDGTLAVIQTLTKLRVISNLTISPTTILSDIVGATLASVDITSADLVITDAAGNGRVLTVTAKTISAASASGTGVMVVLDNNATPLKVLSTTAVVQKSVNSGDPVTTSSFTITLPQAV